jgi:hypothetical protein
MKANENFNGIRPEVFSYVACKVVRRKENHMFFNPTSKTNPRKNTNEYNPQIPLRTSFEPKRP